MLALRVPNSHLGRFSCARGDESALDPVGVLAGLHDRLPADEELLVCEPGRLVEDPGLVGEIELGPRARKPLPLMAETDVPSGGSLASRLVVLRFVAGYEHLLEGDPDVTAGTIAGARDPFLEVGHEDHGPVPVRDLGFHLAGRLFRSLLPGQCPGTGRSEK